MKTYNPLLIINGVDKTDSIASCNIKDGQCCIQYNNNSKVYNYNLNKVQILEFQRKIDPQHLIVFAKNKPLSEVAEILDYGLFFRIILKNKQSLSYPCDEIRLENNCLSNETIGSLFAYFKEIAESVGLVTEKNINILKQQYQKVSFVQENTVLASYLDVSREPKKMEFKSTLIYPFGLNQSQKRAVENAFSSQVSIIQGPPGTGKTQTILNIIANAVWNAKTVAVVSSNNSAVLNVSEKMEKCNLSFLTALLGKRDNKETFLSNQNGQYPNMSEWSLVPEVRDKILEKVKFLSKELSEMLNRKNRIAEINKELIELQPERHYFQEYYDSFEEISDIELKGITSQKILSLWLEYERYTDKNSKIGLLKKLSIIFRFNRSVLNLFLRRPELVIPYLQNKFYVTKTGELELERKTLEKKLAEYSFDKQMNELAEKSLLLFRDKLEKRYHWKETRRRFEMNDFWNNATELNQEYPVILSSTYSIKTSLSIDYIYDYLIIDEASQVDLATGVLAFSCAKNVVIVGDTKQLANVLKKEVIPKTEKIWSKYSFAEMYHFSNQSLLSSAIARWNNVPSVLLREHYRCHPKIIGFCNQKFYQNQLIIMTKDHGEDHVLTMYYTTEGNHARNHLNQRQIDVINKDALPLLREMGFQNQDIGIIAPYRDQVDALAKQLDEKYEVSTVHKFQGREKDAIVLTSVDNVIGHFVDDPNMLNVAISRAVKALVVVTSGDSRNDKTKYGELARYIQYNNCEVIVSPVFSVFDLLYKEYAQRRRFFLRQHKRVSIYDSENLIYAVIEGIIQKEMFQNIDCAIHVSLASIVKDYSLLTEAEKAYTRSQLTHTDFLLFNKMDKSPIMAIEVDGTNFHKEGSRQSFRDVNKNNILEKCGIPLLRLRTDSSDERVQIESMLKVCLE